MFLQERTLYQSLVNEAAKRAAAEAVQPLSQPIAQQPEEVDLTLHNGAGMAVTGHSAADWMLPRVQGGDSMFLRSAHAIFAQALEPTDDQQTCDALQLEARRKQEKTQQLKEAMDYLSVKASQVLRPDAAAARRAEAWEAELREVSWRSILVVALQCARDAQGAMQSLSVLTWTLNLDADRRPVAAAARGEGAAT